MKKVKKIENSENSYLILNEVEGAEDFAKDILNVVKGAGKGLGNIASQYVKTFNYSIKALAKIITGKSLKDLNNKFNSDLNSLNRDFDSIINSMPGSKDAAMFSFLANPGATLSFLLADKQATGTSGSKPTDFLKKFIPGLKPGIDLVDSIYSSLYKSVTGKDINFDKLSREEEKSLKVFKQLMSNLPEPAKSLVKNINSSNSKEFIAALTAYNNDKSEENKKRLNKYLKIESSTISIKDKTLLYEVNNLDVKEEVFEPFIALFNKIIKDKNLVEKIFGFSIEDRKKDLEENKPESLEKSIDSAREKIYESAKNCLVFLIKKQILLISAQAQINQVKEVLHYSQGKTPALKNRSIDFVNKFILKLKPEVLSKNNLNIKIEKSDIGEVLNSLTSLKGKLVENTKDIKDVNSAKAFLLGIKDTLKELRELVNTINKDKSETEKAKDNTISSFENLKDIDKVIQGSDEMPDEFLSISKDMFDKYFKKLALLYNYFNSNSSFIDGVLLKEIEKIEKEFKETETETESEKETEKEKEDTEEVKK